MKNIVGTICVIALAAALGIWGLRSKPAPSKPEIRLVPVVDDGAIKKLEAQIAALQTANDRLIHERDLALTQAKERYDQLESERKARAVCQQCQNTGLVTDPTMFRGVPCSCALGKAREYQATASKAIDTRKRTYTSNQRRYLRPWKNR